MIYLKEFYYESSFSGDKIDHVVTLSKIGKQQSEEVEFVIIVDKTGKGFILYIILE
jgi:hypothetical protein